MTKAFKYLCLFILFITVFSTCGVNAMAVNTNFSISNITEDKKNTITDNLDISLILDEPSKATIECFDVNDNGMIALGHTNYNDAIISVYDSNGIFKYGYGFKYNASFGIEWNNDYINIYLIRSDILVVLDADANVVDVVAVHNTVENDRYKNDCVFSSEKMVGDTKYALRNNMGILNFISTSYSQLVKISSAGEETILYNVNNFQTIKTLVFVCCAVAFVALAIYTIFKKHS